MPLHSHLIKRFDTDAISASSLFKTAYPGASEKEETKEMDWIAVKSKGKYGNTRDAGLEWDEAKKLSGTWYAALGLVLAVGRGRGADSRLWRASQDPGGQRARPRDRVRHRALRRCPDQVPQP